MNHDTIRTRQSHLKRFFRRFSIYGDFWLRYLHWGARHCPWFLEPMFVFAFTVMFWFVLRRARHAVARNLSVLLPGSSPVVNQLRVFRVFWNFAWTMVDVAHVRHGDHCIRWEVSGSKYLEELERDGPGAILLTAHMGNYDVAAPLFAQKIHRPIHLVRTPEREARSQEFEKEKRERQTCGNFVIHYNEAGNMLGVTLARALAESGIVAVQGDRILFDVSPMPVPFSEGIDWQVPKGPFMLAMVAKAAIHPVFIIRMGWRRYRIQAEPVIHVAQDRDRERVMKEAARQWTEVLKRLAKLHWRQWFVFENLFTVTTDAVEQKGEISPSVTKASAVPVDSVIPAASQQHLKTVFFWSLFAGGWTSAVVLRRLLEWAVGDTLHVVGALVVWPLLWFVIMVLIVQSVLSMSLLVMKLLRVSMKAYDTVACSLTVGVFAGVAWSEYRGGCPVGWWLGVLGFAGILLGLLVEGIGLLRPHSSNEA